MLPADFFFCKCLLSCCNAQTGSARLRSSAVTVLAVRAVRGERSGAPRPGLPSPRAWQKRKPKRRRSCERRTDGPIPWAPCTLDSEDEDGEAKPGEDPGAS